jgi:hypothetical protein
MPEVTDLMRVAQWAKSSGAPSDVYNAACRMLDQSDEIAAERDALAMAIERVRADAIEQQKMGTTADPWKLGVYAQASRTRRIINDALDAFEKAAESHGGGRTPQTLGATEGQAATEAHRGSR